MQRLGRQSLRAREYVQSAEIGVHGEGCDEPRLHVGGVVVMGGVQIETRLSGESEWDARRRRRHERKALRKAARQGLLPPKSTGQ